MDIFEYSGKKEKLFIKVNVKMRKRSVNWTSILDAVKVSHLIGMAVVIMLDKNDKNMVIWQNQVIVFIVIARYILGRLQQTKNGFQMEFSLQIQQCTISIDLISQIVINCQWWRFLGSRRG
ncbi:unnamed protein product [Paramecium octaurelia]|uniref:Uncharacterized protein n=1 Tax=Paramecium octaurelia TaxID=43137 RepID=A0A8S1TG40_PAROT|nr:unnamed protein product [Paramecium octaurelia]